jgi:hypothetical protein
MRMFVVSVVMAVRVFVLHHFASPHEIGECQRPVRHPPASRQEQGAKIASVPRQNPKRAGRNRGGASASSKSAFGVAGSLGYAQLHVCR